MRLERHVCAKLNLPERQLLKETLLPGEAEKSSLDVILFLSLCVRNLLNYMFCI